MLQENTEPSFGNLGLFDRVTKTELDINKIAVLKTCLILIYLIRLTVCDEVDCGIVPRVDCHFAED